MKSKSTTMFAQKDLCTITLSKRGIIVILIKQTMERIMDEQAASGKSSQKRKLFKYFTLNRIITV